ncbi:methyl-accepting chemotaxis protein [Myxacorys almedinensis]|uniref:HAMP domain-containing protein n=1 Tax=Myxacorys almedinensis A TaxID=2690445 RepID=A0A8J7Z7G0_9CYAN|nr:methyl-accepting chemotaxis protein [Myxacorys almedinensis]NDJ19516.1 HAMP domain-containing protein [Myxacorys almedinensis A]
MTLNPGTFFSQKTSDWLTWFRTLPLGRKQIAALIVCELIPILGLGVGSIVVLTSSLRSQLRSQAAAEVAVAETNYNLKINQMGFGSRGQSDNRAIIDVATLHQRKSAVPTELQDQVKQILKNEVKARRIEYATLVGQDLQIIVNANNNRAKEPIRTENLVNLIQAAIASNRQIKASETVSWEELQKEGAPLPDGVTDQEALIRYVVTPVKKRDSQEVIGALVFGDIVNGKPAIVAATQTAFSGGYSGVYLRRANGEFALVTSQAQGEQGQLQVGIPLSDAAILAQAATTKGETVTQRVSIGDQTHTIAARAMPNQVVETLEGATAVVTNTPTAILVRGTPETSLNRLLRTSLQQELVVLLASLAAILGWSVLYRRTVINPLEDLKSATEQFAQGDRTARAEISSGDEVGQLAIAFNQMADSIRGSETTLANEAYQQERYAKDAQAVSDITMQIRRSLNTDDIIQSTLEEVRKFLVVDRTMFYQFDHGSVNGTIIAESITDTVDSILYKSVTDWLGLSQIEHYQKRTLWSIENAKADHISDRYRENLRNLNINAEIAVPIRRNGQLVGLLCAQTLLSQNAPTPRIWQPSDLRFLSQLALQLGYALDQAQVLRERQEALQASELLKETLQQQIIQLLGEVQGVARGDLTVRASIGSGDIGTVANSFNTIVESLRQIVLKAQHSATQVNHLLSENEASVRQLADESLHQTHETTRILESVEQMTESVEAVTERARQAAIVAQSASAAAHTGETAMESSVQSIMTLRSTIEGATKTVKQLGDSSQQIARIVSLIHELAAQTDVLAINASLEASRAGEQGRGFAIVASEIGELAARSTAATRDVEKIVEAVQHQTQEVVTVMGQTAVQVVESAHSLKNSRQSLVHMVHLSNQIDDLVRSLLDAMTAQTQTTDAVTALVKDVAHVSTRTSGSSRQVSKALRQTVDVAEELQRSVETFRVERN